MEQRNWGNRSNEGQKGKWRNDWQCGPWNITSSASNIPIFSSFLFHLSLEIHVPKILAPRLGQCRPVLLWPLLLALQSILSGSCLQQRKGYHLPLDVVTGAQRNKELGPRRCILLQSPPNKETTLGRVQGRWMLVYWSSYPFVWFFLNTEYMLQR